ncbi:MAG: DUF2809 domain-containing protein [Gemmataceae bacterium]
MRRRYALLLLATVAAGVASRKLPLGFWPWDKSAGDALYAAAAYFALGVLLPGRVGLRAALALGWCVAIELFQLTGVPSRHADAAVVRWLIGTTFAWHDLACYAVGVALCAVIEWRGTPPRRAAAAD